MNGSPRRFGLVHNECQEFRLYSESYTGSEGRTTVKGRALNEDK